MPPFRIPNDVSIGDYDPGLSESGMYCSELKFKLYEFYPPASGK